MFYNKNFALKDVTETLKEFHSIKINSAILASQLTTIKPRKYSIASAPPLIKDPERNDNNLSLIVGVLKYTTETGRVKGGLATGMLETVDLNTRVLGSIKNANKSNFQLPADPSWPVIMICAGSGIAPFRGFWMRRFQQCQQGYAVGPTFLYFGCRKKSMNLLKNETDRAATVNQG